MKYAYNLSTDQSMGYDDINLPEGINHACWMVLASYLLDNNMGGSIAMHAFNPRDLVMQHINKFSLGRHSVAVGDWSAPL